MPIFDQGYQHWKGKLSGHAWRWMAISRQGFRVQFKGRYVRLLLILAWMPALALVAALAVWGLFERGTLAGGLLSLVRSLGITGDPQAFRQAVWTLAYKYFFQTELCFILLLVTITGPNLISLDLRFNSLPLYLSRPLTRLDYFLGKLGVIAALVAAVAVLPAAGAYVLGLCFSRDLTVVRDTWRLLPASLAYGMVIVLSAGTLMLALSSLSRRSLYVGLTWVGLVLIGWVTAGVLGGIHQGTVFQNRYRKMQELNRAQVQYANEPRSPWEDRRPSRSGGKDAVRAPGTKKPGKIPMLPARQDLAAASGASPSEKSDWLQQQQKILDEIEQAESEVRRTDWRPLFSYMGNLNRIGEALLNTDAAWVQFGRATAQGSSRIEGMAGDVMGPWPNSPGAERFNERRLAEEQAPQYPWTWSAAVLAGLGGLSLCILSTRVKSLDRLR